MQLEHNSPLLCYRCGFNACFKELPVCEGCLFRLQEILTARCRKCGETFGKCQCFTSKGIKFISFYNGYESQRLIMLLKFSCDERLFPFFAELLVKGSGIDVSSFDGVTFAPRVGRNIRYYGYDQAKFLAKSVSEVFGIPFIEILHRNGGQDQKLLSYSQRLKNITGRYFVKTVPEKKYKKLLLVDDVSTTGATVDVCASILRKHVADSVVVLTFAKTNKTLE